jgi:hypothetical protein
VSTTDTNHYSIMFTAGTDCSAVVTNGEQRLAVQAGQRVTIGPTHHQAIRVTTKTRSNKIGRANRRPGFPLNAGRQFGSASCAPPLLSAAVAHL